MIVWRSTYTTALARAVSAEAHAETLRGEVAWLRGKLDTLDAERIEAAKPRAAVAKKADPVMDAIASVSGSNAGRRKRLGALARSLRTAGESDTAIIERITNWQSTDDDSQADDMTS